MTSRHPPCCPPSPKTPAGGSIQHQHERRRLGNGGIHTSTCTAAGGLAEVGPPVVVSLLAVDSGLTPDNVVGGIHDAVTGVIAGQVRSIDGQHTSLVEIGGVPGFASRERRQLQQRERTAETVRAVPIKDIEGVVNGGREVVDERELKDAAQADSAARDYCVIVIGVVSAAVPPNSMLVVEPLTKVNDPIVSVPGLFPGESIPPAATDTFPPITPMPLSDDSKITTASCYTPRRVVLGV